MSINKNLEILTVKFNSELEIDICQFITPSEASKVPELIDWRADENKFYTVLMMDAPTYECTSCVLHWMVVNVPGKNLSSGEIMLSYRGPGPEDIPIVEGFNRYVFLVFEQNEGKSNFNNLQLELSGDSRLSFSTSDFCTRYKLNPVPTAWNMFICDAKNAN